MKHTGKIKAARQTHGSPRHLPKDILVRLSDLPLPNVEPVSGSVRAVFSDDFFARLSKAGAVTLGQHDREIIIEVTVTALSAYLFDFEGLAARCDRIGAMAAALAAAIRAETALGWDLSRSRSTLLQECDHLASDMAGPSAPKRRPGNAQNVPCDTLILELATIYRSASGKDSDDTPFHSFLATLWTELPGQLRARLAISDQAFVRRAKGLTAQGPDSPSNQQVGTLIPSGRPN